MPGLRAGVLPSELTVEVVSDPRRLNALAAAWDPLVDPSSPGAVFRSGAWLWPWWTVFSAAAGGAFELRVFVARRAGQLAGALPCYRERRLGGRVLRLLGDNITGSDYLGAIAAEADASAVAAAFAARILDEERDLDFSGLLADEPIGTALAAAAAGRRFSIEERALLPCPWLNIAAAPRDFAAWLARLPGGAGPQLLRRRRWLERRPGHHIEIATSEAGVARGIEELFRTHEARWAKEGGSDGIAGETVMRFHRLAAAALARRGEARIYLLHVEGTVAAVLYGFERGGRFAFYQSGSDPAWRARSVGTVVLGAALEDSFGRGLVEFDFLRGGESYKTVLASGRRELVRLRISSGRTLLRLVEGAEGTLRRAAHRLLPKAAEELVRRLRRAGQKRRHG